MEDFDNHIPLKAEEEDDQFPIGLKVLAIDNNIVCLRYLVQLLQICQYNVTATTETAEAIRLLKDEKQTFDIIITNVVRNDMDGFNILQTIGVGMDIPVVIVSAKEELDTIMRGVVEGAKDYLLKPVRLQELQNIWQHVLRKRLARKRPNPNLLLLEEQVLLEAEEDHNITKRSVAINQQDYGQSNEIVKLDDGINVADDSSSKKKKRISWTKELHEKFVEAYEQLGEKERVPNNILKLMNDSRLTRENIASHLQKHRETLKKKKASGVGIILGSHRNLHDRNPTKGSTLYNSMNQINKVSNLGSQFLISNGQGNQNHKSTWTAAGSFFPVPEYKGFNFPSNNSISKPCTGDDNYNQQYLGGFDDPAININSHYHPPLQTNCNFNSTSQNFVGYYAIENHNYDGAGQCYQTQFNAANSFESLLMDDELSEIFK